MMIYHRCVFVSAYSVYGSDADDYSRMKRPPLMPRRRIGRLLSWLPGSRRMKSMSMVCRLDRSSRLSGTL